MIIFVILNAIVQVMLQFICFAFNSIAV